MNDIRKKIDERKPVVHCMTNSVTMCECANAVLAVHGIPIMSKNRREVCEIQSHADALVLNIGTPEETTFEAMRLAGMTAMENKHPIVLDPVGVGTSAYRREEVRKLLKDVRPTLIRGNEAEIKALLGSTCEEKGVDSVNYEIIENRVELAVTLAQRMECVVLLSGPEDIATDGETVHVISGGSEIMRYITGAGCILSVLCGCACAAETDTLAAVADMAALWKECGKRSEASVGKHAYGKFRIGLFDALSDPGTQPSYKS